ncbi:MAG TPA: histone deacetylase [Flavitalea sp.]|nr:histone deacetylase [Flavitalea sp.]
MLYIAYDPLYVHPLPDGHRFPMLKYELIPGQLLYEGTITEASLHRPASCPLDIVALTHSEEYIDKLVHQTLSAKEQRQIGFPQSPSLTERELVITQGTIDCSLHALQYGVALNVAGGTHHAFADHGEGFCLLNDFAVAANYLLAEKLVNKILVVDLDVHQGNGTAKLFQSIDEVFTFSMHGKNNYPFHKERSDLDLELPDGINDADYLRLLHQHVPTIVDDVKPELVFYLSGVDILSSDKFGKLKVSMEACRERDRFVLTTMHKRNIPVAIAMGGGYSADVKIIVEAHCNTFRLAKEVYEL